MIARDFGFSTNYAIIPFKGLYLYGDEPSGSLKTNIYPVPDLNNPFLGVHFTISAYGDIKIGPTAIPAFWREHYKGMQNFKFSEMMDVLYRECRLWLNNDANFRKLAGAGNAKIHEAMAEQSGIRAGDGCVADTLHALGKTGDKGTII